MYHSSRYSSFSIVYTYPGWMCLGCEWGGDNNGGRLGFWGSLRPRWNPAKSSTIHAIENIRVYNTCVCIYIYSTHTHTHMHTRTHTQSLTVLPSSLSISYSILCVNVYTCVICVSMKMLCVWVFFLCFSRHCWFSRKFWSPCPVFADKNLSRTTL